MEDELKTTGMNILVVQMVSKKLKYKRIKSGSKKFRIKSYKRQTLFSGCLPVMDNEINTFDVGDPVQDGSKLIIPINISYKAQIENINIKINF